MIGGYTGSFGAGLSDFYLLKMENQTIVPDVSVKLIPDNPPVIVPRGGSFTYTGMLINNTLQSQPIDAWIMVDVPNIGMIGPLRQYNNIPLPPVRAITVNNISQDVPGGAPVGLYDFIGYCGGYPGSPIDSSFIEVTVIQ